MFPPPPQFFFDYTLYIGFSFPFGYFDSLVSVVVIEAVVDVSSSDLDAVSTSSPHGLMPPSLSSWLYRG